MAKEVKKITNKDILNSQGLVEVTDPVTGRKSQIKKEDAVKKVKELEALKAELSAEDLKEDK